jgi:hypothetical protein
MKTLNGLPGLRHTGHWDRLKAQFSHTHRWPNVHKACQSAQVRYNQKENKERIIILIYRTEMYASFCILYKQRTVSLLPFWFVLLSSSLPKWEMKNNNIEIRTLINIQSFKIFWRDIFIVDVTFNLYVCLRSDLSFVSIFCNSSNERDSSTAL